MACCLAAPSHYLNQCWLISKVPWYSPQGTAIKKFEDTNQWNKIENLIYKITSRSPKGQWVKHTPFYKDLKMSLHHTYPCPTLVNPHSLMPPPYWDLAGSVYHVIWGQTGETGITLIQGIICQTLVILLNQMQGTKWAKVLTLYRIDASTKWPLFCRRHLQIHFLGRKCFSFHWNSFLRV